jgi:hypothetical protein
MASMEKFFSILGKLTLAIIVIGGLAGGGYYLGNSGKLSIGNIAPTPEPNTTTNPQAEAMTTLAVPTSTPSAKTKTTTAGVGAESGLSFTKYTIDVPEGWTPLHTSTNEGTAIDSLTITSGTHEIKIFQAATGGALCLYPGDADFEGPSSRYDTFVDIVTKDSLTLRRGSTNIVSGTKKTFTLCQKGTESYGQPTGFGHITFSTSLTPDPVMLQQMDSMIKSLKKI